MPSGFLSTPNSYHVPTISILIQYRAQLQEVCPNTPVSFYDQTTQNPIGCLWRVNPSSYVFANGTDSTSQNPQIVFWEEGSYSVSLNSSNKYGSDELNHQNYIISKSKLDVKFKQLGNNNVVCGCDLKAFPMVVKGAISYDYKIDQPGRIETKSNADTLFLTLNPTVAILKSFDTWVKVIGTNGMCNATDSLLLHIIIQPNDKHTGCGKITFGTQYGIL